MIKNLTIIALVIATQCLSTSAKEADDPTSSPLPNGDLLITDFEQKDLGRMRAWGWQFHGDAFNREYSHGTRKLRARVGRYEGKWFLTSVTENPKSVGTLTSPPFQIQKPFISFLLSGGSSETKLQANLIIEGKVTRTVTGNDSDIFEPVSFDVREFINKEGRFQIIDNATSIWGHINVDQITQTDQAKGKRTISNSPTPPKVDSGFAQLIDSGKRISGPFNLKEGKITNDKNESTPFENTLSIFTNKPVNFQANADFIRLRNGESWSCKITGIEDRKISVQTSFAGTQSIPLSQIRMLEFNKKEKGPDNGKQPGTLYRIQGEPIPGKLIWIREKDIAIESPLGIIPIPRQGIRRFVVSDQNSEETNTRDELALTDGTRIRGNVVIDEAGDHLSVTHDIVGKLRFPLNGIHSLKRRPKNVAWLSDLRAKTYKATGPIIAPPSPKLIKSLKSSITSLKINPQSQIIYSVPELSPGQIIFRSTIAPGQGNRGSVVTSLGSLNKNTTTNIDPDSKEQLVQIMIDPGSELELKVNFQGRLIFPCAIELRDAHFVSLSANQKTTQTRTKGT
ncbi:MAG: hypothetical protein VX577_04940 [Verrucomicrobiota bacterium]|nr:hypothetical protein [Verrucomicrobiota bacterium]